MCTTGIHGRGDSAYGAKAAGWAQASTGPLKEPPDFQVGRYGTRHIGSRMKLGSTLSSMACLSPGTLLEFTEPEPSVHTSELSNRPMVDNWW